MLITNYISAVCELYTLYVSSIKQIVVVAIEKSTSIIIVVFYSLCLYVLFFIIWSVGCLPYLSISLNPVVAGLGWTICCFSSLHFSTRNVISTFYWFSCLIHLFSFVKTLIRSKNNFFYNLNFNQSLVFLQILSLLILGFHYFSRCHNQYRI